MSAATGLWRPPQWSGPAMVSITVPPQSNNNSQQSTSSVTNSIVGSTPSSVSLSSTATAVPDTTPNVTPPQVYVFDAVFTLEHEQRLEKTRHPVQTGADISSHAYLMPARVSMYVGMSDAMDSYATGRNPKASPYVQPWTGNSSKSVSAYQQMLKLQASRIPLTVTTRLRTYTNMVITSIGPQEDVRTIKGLRMRIEFEQIFTAAIASAPISARNNDTQTTGLGAVNSQTPDGSLIDQFSAPADGQAPVDVPGAGDFTSNLGSGVTP